MAELARDTAFDGRARCQLLAEWALEAPIEVARAEGLGCAAQAVASGD